eukprot:2832192-Pleurochrysis_carterae.AAC.1
MLMVRSRRYVPEADHYNLASLGISQSPSQKSALKRHTVVLNTHRQVADPPAWLADAGTEIKKGESRHPSAAAELSTAALSLPTYMSSSYPRTGSTPALSSVRLVPIHRPVESLKYNHNCKWRATMRHQQTNPRYHSKSRQHARTRTHGRMNARKRTLTPSRTPTRTHARTHAVRARRARKGVHTRDFKRVRTCEHSHGTRMKPRAHVEHARRRTISRSSIQHKSNAYCCSTSQRMQKSTSRRTRKTRRHNLRLKLASYVNTVSAAKYQN